MKVYIELVFFNNLALDFLLIIATLTFRRKRVIWWRIWLASVFGSAIAVGYAVAPQGLQIAIRVLLAPILTLIFDKTCGNSSKDKVKDYIFSLLVFAFLTFTVGGVVYGLGYMLDVDLNSYASLGLTAIAVSLVFVAVRVVLRKKTIAQRKTVSVTMHLGATCVNATALCDSGNSLTDIISGLPIVIVSQNVEKQFDEGVSSKKISIDGYVTAKTVTEEKQLPIVKLDSIDVDGKTLSAYCALSKKSFDGFDVILQNTMF